MSQVPIDWSRLGTQGVWDATLAQGYLAAIVSSSDDAIIAKNLDGIVQWGNAAVERVFGYTPLELVGRSVRILIPPDRQHEEDEILARLRKGERIDHYETVRIGKDGRELDISLTVSPVRDASGAIVGVSKTARDITEQKRAQRELAAQKEWLRVTLASIGDGIIASDPQGRVTYLNAVAEQLTGWSNEQAQGRGLADVFEIVNEITRQRVENPAGLVLRSGRIVGLANHTVLIGRDGVERPITDSAAPILDDAGRTLGVVLAFRDVTEQRRAEELVAEQREWFETTLESVGDAVMATDVHGRVVFMNPVAEQLTGWTVEEAREHACTDIFRIVNEDTRHTVENPVTRVLQHGVVVGLANHTLLIAKDGTERPIDDSGAPIRNRHGRIVGAVLVFRDVTERRRADAERERLLTAERIARAEAERANRLKDDFVAMVSHELRTPLNAILGWTDLMLKRPDDPALAARGLETVSRNTRLQAQLVADLLDISRIVSGKLSLELQGVQLAAVVEAAVESVEPAAAKKGLTIDKQLDATIAPVVGDPARLQQVLSNLLSNALKFTSSGGTIRVTLRRKGTDAEIVVADDGSGIAPEFLPHVFDRFQQADASRSRRFGGLGLGLSIAKNLVQLHGGAVVAESEGLGRGATFTVTLPVVAPPTLRDDAPHSAASGEGAPREMSLEGIRILVVEDDADGAEFVRRVLESYGAAVHVAASAQAALDSLATARPDILISDIGLPELDGYQLLERIRQDGSTHGAAVYAIALTAFAGTDDRRRALRAGYQAHLAKPIDSGDLLATAANFAELIKRSPRGGPDGLTHL
jgi:PAS domain S-box-containing protein